MRRDVQPFFVRRRNKVAGEQVEFLVADHILMATLGVPAMQTRPADFIGNVEEVQLVPATGSFGQLAHPGSARRRVRWKIKHDRQAGS